MGVGFGWGEVYVMFFLFIILLVICIIILKARKGQKASVKQRSDIWWQKTPFHILDSHFIPLGNVEKNLDFYADDLTAFLDGSQASLCRTVLILDHFRKISDLQISLTKYTAVWRGKNRFWSHKFRLLGIDKFSVPTV